MDTATLVSFASYLFILFAIGFFAWRRTSSIADYVLGGRTLGPGVTALSAGASDMSGWLLLGLPGAIYLSGLQEGWIVVGLLLGAWANWRLVAGALRHASADADDALTLPELLSRIIGHGADQATLRLLRLTATALILFFFTFYVAAGLVAGARLFESTLELDYLTALAIGTGIIVAYTMAGGFLAVSWTDFFQGCLMLLALVAVPLLLVIGPTAAGDIAPGHLDPFAGLTPLALLSLLAWGLGYFGQPHILARFMAIRSEAELPRARRIGMSWMLITTVAAVAVGLGGSAVFGTGLPEAETVFIHLTQLLFHPLVAGIVLAAILAAVMSTIDSQLLVASTCLAEDVYKPWLRPEASSTELVTVGRFAVVAVAVLALLLAADPDNRVLTLVSHAWAGLGASFGPVLLLALHWPRLTAAGALAGMLTGGITVVVWSALSGGLFEVYELLPAFLLAGAVAMAVSVSRDAAAA
ncbi:MAG: sodium/proline symporter PutP [Gammaproteobacteria bacterium]|nr:sodium/proline symporter PutP [Gammaproteobacteria bacterium]